MKPRFVDGMKNITVEMGQDATFVCVVSEIHVRNMKERPEIWWINNIIVVARDTEWVGSRPTARPSRR